VDVGQAFIPHRMFIGLFIPAGLARYSKLTGSAKLVWGQLALYAGERGVAWPSQAALAREVGLSRRTVTGCLAELKGQNLIYSAGTHRRRTVWGFLWHPCLEGSVRNLPTSERGSEQELLTTGGDAPQEPDSEAKYAESAHDSKQDLRKIVSKICAPPSKRIMDKNQGRESSSTVDSVVDDRSNPQPASRSPDDDDPRSLFDQLWIPGSPDRTDGAELQKLIGQSGAETIRRYLRAAANTKTCRGTRVLPYLRRCIESERKEAVAVGSERRYNSEFGP